MSKKYGIQKKEYDLNTMCNNLEPCDIGKCHGDRFEMWVVSHINASYEVFSNEGKNKNTPFAGFWKIDEWRGDKAYFISEENGDAKGYFTRENSFPDLKLIAEEASPNYKKGDAIEVECKYRQPGSKLSQNELTDIHVMHECLLRESPKAFFYVYGRGSWTENGPEEVFVIPGPLLTTEKKLSTRDIERIIQTSARKIDNGNITFPLQGKDDPALFENWEELKNLKPTTE